MTMKSGILSENLTTMVVSMALSLRGGAFIARPTSEAIYDLVRTFQSGRYGEIVRHGEDMNHEYIEKIDWNPIGGYFRVETGS